MTDILQFFVTMMMVSVISFGGGAVAIFYQVGVEQMHWMTASDLSSVLAFGYATPGPAVFGTATFLGYKVAGLPGLLVGSVGIFIVPWLLSLGVARYFERWFERPRAVYVVRAVSLAAAGVIITAALSLMPPTIATNIWYMLILLGAFTAVGFWRVSPLIVLTAGLIAGLFVM